MIVHEPDKVVGTTQRGKLREVYFFEKSFTLSYQIYVMDLAIAQLSHVFEGGGVGIDILPKMSYCPKSQPK